MIAEFYICNLSFKHNGNDSEEVFINKIRLFCDLIRHIMTFPPYNSVHYNASQEFNEVQVTPSGETLYEVLTMPEVGHRVLGRDLYQRFQESFFFGDDTSMCLDDLRVLVEMEDANVCHGVLVLNKIKEFADDTQVVSTIPEWRVFRREHIRKRELSGLDLLQEVNMSFPTIVIHPQTEHDLDSLLKTHKNKIITALSVLNDYFFADLLVFKGSHPEFLAQFGHSHGLDGSSFEGRGDDKFYRSFDGIRRYCEPHLKIYSDDKGTREKNCRIYFEFPLDINEPKLIYVGYICEHL